MRKNVSVLLAMIGALLAAPAAGKDTPPADAARLRALEAAVSPQDWYPPGYYDLRIAAEAEVAEKPDPLGAMIQDWGDGVGKRYDIDCVADSINTADADALTQRYGNIALAVARRRNDLVRVGYPAAVWAEPLLTFERALLKEATARTDVELRIDLGIASDDEYDRHWAAREAAEAEGNNPELIEPPVIALAAAIDANRAQISPRLPRVTSDGCGGDAAPAPVIFKTLPSGGRVHVISSFAFKVCTRRLSDPWDPLSCRWSEVETGVPTDVRGRIAYQVRWPDGSMRRGVRDLDMNYDDEKPTVSVLRK